MNSLQVAHSQLGEDLAIAPLTNLGDFFRSYFDISKIQVLENWNLQTHLASGITLTVKWHEEFFQFESFESISL